MSVEESTTVQKQLVTRRRFLKMGLWSTSVLTFIPVFKRWFDQWTPRSIPGRIMGASAAVGHRLRDGAFPPPAKKQTIGTVIVGGGMAGLSAAWWLKKHGYDDFVLLELEETVGGNSQSGINSISEYPWGAHYLPLPGTDSKYVRDLLEELGVIEGYDQQGLPRYNEFHLCADPHERLLRHGRWQDGLVPQIGITEDDRRQWDEFFATMDQYRRLRGRDGKQAFTIPLDLSSQDSDLLDLDRQSMANFIAAKGWDSKVLQWYVNYCCRDDYGTTANHISAWAGIHYFASRRGESANADGQTVLTWPAGNGWLVQQLRQKLVEHIRTGAIVYSVDSKSDANFVDYHDLAKGESLRVQSRDVIMATPRFVAARLMGQLKNQSPSYLQQLHYSPWMVANIALSTHPEGKGAPLSWDNVSFNSPSLGYIVATHQDLAMVPKKTVITYYLPLSHTDPTEARREAFLKTHADWVTTITADMESMHPGIRNIIETIDVWIWGHGMISPMTGYLWGKDRKEMLNSMGSVHFAHSDMSGISIFEEAQYRGVLAAEKVLDKRQQSRRHS